MSLAEFWSLLDACLSPVDAERARGEAALEALSKDPPTYFRALSAALSSADGGDARRSLAAVLLRKVAAGGEGYRALPPGDAAALRAALVHVLGSPGPLDVRRKAVHAAAAVAVAAAGAGFRGWPELLQCVFTTAQDASPPAREFALFLFRNLVQATGADGFAPHADALRRALGALLADADARVAVAALQGAAALIAALDAPDARRPFLELMPAVLRALARALAPPAEGGDEAAARDALAALTEVVSAAPAFMRDFIQPAANAMLTIVNTASFEDDTRALGLEFLLVLAEHAGASVRKHPALVSAVLQLATAAMTACEDEPGWAAADNSEESYLADGQEDASELVGAAMSGVDRLAQAIGGKVMVPALDAVVSPLLASPDWRARRAGVLAMALALEGCVKVLAPNARALVTRMLPFLRDAHPRVRFVALRFFNQLAIDLNDPNGDGPDGGDNAELAAEVVSRARGGGGGGGGGGAAGGGGGGARAGRAAAERLPGLCETAGDLLLPALIEATTAALNGAAPRLRGVAACALSDFLDEDTVDAELVEAHAPALTRALFDMLQTLPPGHVVSQGHALSAVGAAAQVLGDGFAPYYAAVRGPLKALVAAPSTPSSRFLRNRGLDCLARVCEAVGREVAGLDAGECLNSLLRAEREGFAPDDAESAAYAVGALSRLADCLGADFVPYLPYVLELYVPKATRVVDVSIVESEDESGAYNVAVDSDALEEKTTAATLLQNLVIALGADVPGFWPHLDRVAGALAGLVDFKISTLRARGVVGLSFALRAALADTADPGHGQRMLDAVVPVLTARLGGEERPGGELKPAESDTEVLHQVAEAAEECLKMAYESCRPGYAGIAGAERAAGAPPPAPPPGGFPRATVSLAHLPALFNALRFAFCACAQRRAETARETSANPDADDEDAAQLAERLAEEDAMLSSCADATGYALKAHGQAALPALQGLAGELLGWLGRRDPWDAQLRVAALCLADDLIEHASPGAHVILDGVLPHIVECVTHASPAVRQPALYGVGVLAAHGGPKFGAYVLQCAGLLRAVAAAPGAREERAAFATDNAVSSLIKLCRHRAGDGLNVDEMMAFALAYLPFKHDAMEATLVHGWLVDALAGGGGGGGDAALFFGPPPGAPRMAAALGALARALAAHRANVDAAAAKAAAAAAGEDDDEEGAADEEELLDARAVAALQSGAVAAALRAGPYAQAAAAALRGLKPKDRNTLGAFALSL